MKILEKIFSKPYRMMNAANTTAAAIADERAVRDFTKFRSVVGVISAFLFIIYAVMYVLKWCDIIDYRYAGTVVLVLAISVGVFAYALHVALGMIKSFIPVMDNDS